MNLIPRDNVTEFDRIFDSFFGNNRPATSNGKAFFSPHVDIDEHDGYYLIKADLPGVNKEDVKVTLEDGVLTLEAERKEETSEESQGKVIRRERRSGKYARSFHVGRHLAVEDIEGNFNNGVLTVKVQKDSAQEAASREVAIN